MANSILAPNASLRRLGAYKEYQFIPLEKDEVKKLLQKIQSNSNCVLIRFAIFSCAGSYRSC